MTNFQIKTVDASNNEAVVRDMTEAETAVLQAHAKKELAEVAELAAKAEARSAAEAKLLELGLTTEDLKALLG